MELQPRAAINGQALADFVVEFTYGRQPEESDGEKDTENVGRAQSEGNNDNSSKKRSSGPTWPVWELHVNGASNAHETGACVILINPDEEN